MAPSLSLCMIVRDGEPWLGPSLASAKDIVSEIVVVDTGSVDDSVAIARRLGARVIETPWQNDFSVARNVALQEARSDWVLFLDADEELCAESRQQVTEAIADPLALAYSVTIVSDEGHGAPSLARVVRLFRKRPSVHFVYPIHEQVLPSLLEEAERTGEQIRGLPEVQLLHHGYRPNGSNLQDKQRRNHELFVEALQADPENLYLHYKFADSLRDCGGEDRHLAADRAYQVWCGRSLTERTRWFESGELLAVVVASWLERGQRDRAFSLFDEHPPRGFASPAYEFVAAQAYEAVGQPTAALECLERMDLWNEDPRVTHRPGLRGHLSAVVRARVLAALGRDQESLRFALSALQECPEYSPAHLVQAHALAGLGRTREQLEVLVQACRKFPGESPVLNATAQALRKAGLEQQAIRLQRLSGSVVPSIPSPTPPTSTTFESNHS